MNQQPQQQKTYIVQAELNCIKSIAQAERKKAMYENKGYNLIKTIAGFNQIKFIYKPNN
jgi:hypothetical protein